MKFLKDGRLSIVFSNLRSIVNKWHDFVAEVLVDNPDIIGVTESWLHSDIGNSEISIPGYYIFRQDRLDTTKGRGGGVLLYIRDSINCIDRTAQVSHGFSNCIWCEVNTNSSRCGNSNTVLIGIIYRSPNSTPETNQLLFDCVRAVSSKQVILLGDFNFPDINWHLCTSGPHGKDFLDLVSDCFLTQHVLFPTRGNNCLDLILSSDPNLVSNVVNKGKIGSCDHDLISFDVHVFTQISSCNRLVPDFNKADFEGMKLSLSIDWHSLLSSLSPDDAWLAFRDRVNRVVKTFVPLRKCRNSRRPVWLSRDVLRAVRKKRKLWRQFKLSNSGEAYARFKKQESMTKVLIREAKVLFEKRLARNIKVNPKSFHSYVRSKRKTKDVVGPLCDDGGAIVSESRDMANLLNDYFVSVFTTESPVSDCVSVLNEPETVLTDVIFSVDVIRDKLHGLNPNKSPGPDSIHPQVLHSCSDVLALPLSIIFDKCFNDSFVPHDWRIANVTPIFKKGDHSSPCNYRPVSLTSVVCKVMESVIKDAVLNHLLSNGLLNLSQHGFLPKRSCVSNLLGFLDNVTQLVDLRNDVDVIYLDFQKAFDKVPLNRLMLKVKSLGVQGSIADWIRAWLSNRLQRVVINGNMSSWKCVSSGVPQGSVLGPLLFLIFINDIDDGINSEILKFADDTKLYRKVNNTDDSVLLQSDLDKLVDWSQRWQMSFNVSKCKVLHLGQSNHNLHYSMNGVTLVSVEDERDLGVNISNSLKPSKQCAMAAARANRILGLIRRNFNCLGREVVLNLYKQLVRPHLEYAIQSWCPFYDKDKFLLEQVQRRATRLISDVRHLPYECRLRSLGLTTLNLRRVRGDMIQVFKFLSGNDVLSSCNFLKLASCNRTRGHSFKLSKDFSRLDIRKFSFAHRVVNEWNGLPAWVVNSESVNGFKKNIDLFFTNTGRI